MKIEFLTNQKYHKQSSPCKLFTFLCSLTDTDCFMWQSLGRFILRFRLPLLILLAAITAFMGYHASKVQLSYDFARAIPINNPKYKVYQEFKKKFGEDGNLLVLGIQTDKLLKKNCLTPMPICNAN